MAEDIAGLQAAADAAVADLAAIRKKVGDLSAQLAAVPPDNSAAIAAIAAELNAAVAIDNPPVTPPST